MTTPKHENALIEALQKAQAAFPAVEKKREAKAGQYSYNYANIDDVIALTRKPLLENGLVVVQPIKFLDGATVLSTELHHISGGIIFSEMKLPVDNLRPQEVGSLLTYYRRYALSSLLGISSEADDDGQMAHDAKKNGGEEVAEDFMNLTILKSQLRAFDTALKDIKPDAPDARKQLDALQKSYNPILNEAETRLPTWWTTKPGSSQLGIQDRILQKENDITEANLKGIE